MNKGRTANQSTGRPLSKNANAIRLPATRRKRKRAIPFRAFHSPIIASAAGCVPMLEEVVLGFWGLSADISFVSISEDMHYFWQGEDFYVSQLQIAPASENRPEPLIALLRLSETACATLMGEVLGERDYEQPFDFRRMSPLEASILSEFSRDLLICVRQQLIRQVSKNTKFSGSESHLLWTIRPDSKTTDDDDPIPNPVGTMILSLPPEGLNAPLFSNNPVIDSSHRELDDSFFYHIKRAFPLYIGSGKMALSDMHGMETDDIVLLEASRIDRLFLVDEESGERFSFKANPEEMRRNAPLTIDDDLQEPSLMSTPGQKGKPTRQSLWDNLMIDVSAQFEPVRLPLRQLKQMTEGLVVEMGDLLHNRVNIQVEGKTLARGELVIVGDRFAVRVVEVLSQEEAAEEEENNASYANTSPDSGGDFQNDNYSQDSDDGNDDESDLDDFLNDDFDETDEN